MIYTTPYIPTRETPFRLALETEAMIPLNISIPSLRVECYDQIENEAQLRANLDLLEETRERAAIYIANY